MGTLSGKYIPSGVEFFKSIGSDGFGGNQIYFLQKVDTVLAYTKKIFSREVESVIPVLYKHLADLPYTFNLLILI